MVTVLGVCFVWVVPLMTSNIPSPITLKKFDAKHINRKTNKRCVAYVPGEI